MKRFDTRLKRKSYHHLISVRLWFALIVATQLGAINPPERIAEVAERAFEIFRRVKAGFDSAFPLVTCRSRTVIRSPVLFGADSGLLCLNATSEVDLFVKLRIHRGTQFPRTFSASIVVVHLLIIENVRKLQIDIACVRKVRVLFSTYNRFLSNFCYNTFCRKTRRFRLRSE